jgi:predicted small metal-binding protein
MKMMRCNELGGACDKEFFGDTFEEIAKQSKEHGIEMINLGDKDHINAMEKMGELMGDSKNLDEWMNEKKNIFDSRK